MPISKKQIDSTSRFLPSTHTLIRRSDQKFLKFLQNELALSTDDIAVALRQRKFDNAPLPMLLWQYGLVNLEQLERIFDWLEDQD